MSDYLDTIKKLYEPKKKVTIDGKKFLNGIKKLSREIEVGESQTVCPQCEGLGFYITTEGDNKFMTRCVCHNGIVDTCSHCGKGLVGTSNCSCEGYIKAQETRKAERAQEEAIKRKEFIEKTPKITLEEFFKKPEGNFLFFEDYDKYVSEDEIDDFLEENPEAKDSLVFATKLYKPSYDARNILDCIYDEAPEDFEISDEEEKNLQNLLDMYFDNVANANKFYTQDEDLLIIL